MAVPTVFVSHASRGNLFVSQVNYFAKMGAGAMLLPGGTGGKKPPASSQIPQKIVDKNVHNL